MKYPITKINVLQLILGAMFILTFFVFVKKEVYAYDTYISALNNENWADTWSQDWIGQTFTATTSLNRLRLSLRVENNGMNYFDINICSGLPSYTSADQNCSGFGQTEIYATTTSYNFVLANTNYSPIFELDNINFCFGTFYNTNAFFTVTPLTYNAKFWGNNDYPPGDLLNWSFDNNMAFAIYTSTGFDCEPVTFSGSDLMWHYPQDGYYDLSNDEWSDWGLFYQLAEADIGDWNLLMVHWTDSNNQTGTDWDIVSTTTEPVYWTINREHNFPDGQSYSQAKLVKITDCDNYYDDSCTWVDIASTDIISWSASSTGYTIFDNPYYLPGFTPASSSSESTENSGILGSVVEFFKNIFPLSIAFQFNEIFYNLAHAEYAGLSIKANTLVPPAMAVAFDDSVVLMSGDKWNEIFPWWAAYVYPTMQAIIHTGFLFLAIYIIWPRLKSKET